jgi:glutamate 5-kinase
MDLPQLRRIVVKIGTRLLVDAQGHPDQARLEALVSDICAVKKQGIEVVLVSSGAIGAGVEALNLATRPNTLPEIQMAAAIGQTRLMSRYDQLFSAHEVQIGQVLLTHEDLKHRVRHLNARNTMNALLSRGFVPVVNENDVISVDEIKVGDNDVLAAMVTILVEADMLVLLTSADGFLLNGERLSRIEEITPTIRAQAGGKGSALSTGGMETKLEAAEQVCQVGAAAVIADGRAKEILQQIIAGADVGTLVRSHPEADVMKRKRKHWLAFFHKIDGAVSIDEGAENALVENGKSLLPIGIYDVDGDFSKGSLLQIKSRRGTVLAQGLSDYSSGELRAIKGLPSNEIESVLGVGHYDEAIHRDNLVLLKSKEEI